MQAGMKRHAVELQDPADRAQTYRKGPLQRIHLDQIGYHSKNRGGLGCSSRHTHEVARDCVRNGVQPRRYKHVDIVKIPLHKLEEFRTLNRNGCEGDPLMPKFAEGMTYVCLTNTHFTHAQKLAKDGNRTLFDQNKVPIAFRDDDVEANEIQKHGPLCAIYDEKLLDDHDAVQALMQEDNMNASVQMGEDEMSALTAVERTIEQMGPDARDKQKDLDIKKILQRVRTVGCCGNFSDLHIAHFIKFCGLVPKRIAEDFRTCQFHIVGGQVRVRAEDFNTVTMLDETCPRVKAATLMHTYSTGNL